VGHHVESTHTTNLGMNVPSFGTHWIQHDQGEGGNSMRIFFLPQLHYLAIRVPKQLIYNYTTIKAWKYNLLKNKMTCQKLGSCNVVAT